MDKDIIIRAWHKPTKTMWWFNVSWGNCHAGGGYIGMLPMTAPKLHYKRLTDNRTPIDPDDCEFMLCVVLLEEDSEETPRIYEKDILEVYCGGVKQDSYYVVDTLRQFYKDLDTTDSYLRLEEDKLRVVGNIYQNPKLLKG